MKIVIDGPDQILYQWDKGQRLLLHGAESGARVDFALCNQNKAVSKYAYSEDGAVFCDIPDSLLMDPNHLHGYVYEIDGDRGETVREFMIPVIRRPMPEDYVAPDEVLTWHELERRIKIIEDDGVPDEKIAQAVEDYLEENPVQPSGSAGTVEIVDAVERPPGSPPTVTETEDSTPAARKYILGIPSGSKGVGIKDTVVMDSPNGYTSVTISYTNGDEYTLTIPHGRDGDDYVLTDVDKQEIAEMAAELVEAPEQDSSQNVELDTTLTQSGKAADAGAVGARLTALEQLGGFTVIEPAEDDIPKVFFGGALAQTKTEVVVPFRYISKTQDFSGYAEIKAQGNSSFGYAKKNQTVKMFKDADCTEKLKVDFKGWGKQNKHVYKANWIDLTHARNVVSARIWGDIVKSRANYEELPELLRTSPNQGAVDGFPIKVYADGVYQGRYTLNIPKDGWMANMDDDLNTHCILCGEGYVSGCFREASVSQWTDELHDSMPSAIRTRWIEVINFVMNSSDEEFTANLGNYFDIPSLIDYHLYGLASCGFDAFGKNQLYMTYDGQKWIATMYDMDSTWGLWWNGTKLLPTDYPRTSYEDYISAQATGQGNLLYIRLEQCFHEELQSRWAELKNGVLTIENIINRFERFTDITPLDLVKEDYASTTGGGKFTGIPSQTTNNIQQIRAFALARLAWTDEYVAGLRYVPCTGIELSTSTLTFTEEGTQALTATVTPNDCTDVLTWESDNTSVATVVGGVVTAVANGSAVITAKCGGHSASCSVSVSGVFEPVPCTGITLDKTELTFTGAGTQTLTATATPDGCTDQMIWVSSNPEIAYISVDGSVCTVQAVDNGNTTISVACGDKTASCTVAVSGIAEFVDYNLDLFANAEWHSGYKYGDSGVMTAANNEHCTDKFVNPQNCCYKLTGPNYTGVYVWDENDKYLYTYETNGSSVKEVFVVVPKGYKLALKTYSTTALDTSGILFKPVDNHTAAYKEINLAELSWKTGVANGIETQFDFTGMSFDSSNYLLAQNSTGYKLDVTKGLAFAIYNNSVLCAKHGDYLGESLAEYFRTNDIRLILNHRQKV